MIKTRGRKKGSNRPIGAGSKIVDVDWGKVFSKLTQGYNKMSISDELGIKQGTFSRKLRLFMKEDEVEHIYFVIAELEGRLKEIKK